MQSRQEDLVHAAEASSLGWKPGYRARTLMFQGAEFMLVQTKKDSEGDVMFWLYFSSYIQKYIKVFND